MRHSRARTGRVRRRRSSGARACPATDSRPRPGWVDRSQCRQCAGMSNGDAAASRPCVGHERPMPLPGSVNSGAVGGLERVEYDNCVDDPLPPNHPTGLTPRKALGGPNSSLGGCLGTVTFHHEERRAPYFRLDRHDEVTPKEPTGCSSNVINVWPCCHSMTRNSECNHRVPHLRCAWLRRLISR